MHRRQSTSERLHSGSAQPAHLIALQPLLIPIAAVKSTIRLSELGKSSRSAGSGAHRRDFQGQLPRTQVIMATGQNVIEVGKGFSRRQRNPRDDTRRMLVDKAIFQLNDGDPLDNESLVKSACSQHRFARELLQFSVCAAQDNHDTTPYLRVLCVHVVRRHQLSAHLLRALDLVGPLADDAM
jgi:hypothetical protein